MPHYVVFILTNLVDGQVLKKKKRLFHNAKKQKNNDLFATETEVRLCGSE